MDSNDLGPAGFPLATGLLDRLTDAEQERLQSLLRQAHARRTVEHSAAIDAVLARVPVLLRDTLRRMLVE